MLSMRASDTCSNLTVDAVIMPWISQFLSDSSVIFAILGRDFLLSTNINYKLLCPRGTQTCALAVANIKVNGNGKVILDTHPESDQHQNWTCSRGSTPAPTHQIWWWSMNPFLRYLADKQSAHRLTDTQTDTRRWPQDLAAYGAQVKRNGDNTPPWRTPANSLKKLRNTLYASNRYNEQLL